MDRRKLIAIFIANELEMENYFMCMMMVTLMYMFVAWHYERNVVNNNRVFANHETRFSFVNRLLESDVFCISQVRTDRRIDIVAGLSEVAEKMCSSFQQEAKERMGQFCESIQPLADSYPKYLAMELKRLGFSAKDNLSISKAMRMDPSNVEVFKIIETDAEKIEFASSFMVE